LNLILLAAGVIYFYYAKKCFDRGQRSGPHFLLFGLVLLTAVSVGLALSRGGIIFGAVLFALFIFLAVVQQIRFAFEERTSIRATVIALVVLSPVVAGFLSQVDRVAVQKRFEGVQTTLAEGEVNQRTLATKATFEMGMARMWTGWGAGSFRYVFPMYQRKYPEIFFRTHVKHGYFGRLYWRYAHNDIVQFFAEYGIVGFSLQLFFIFSLVGSILWHSVGHGFAVFYALAGLLVALGHATIDFIFSSPAYWMAFIGLIVVFAKLLLLSGLRRLIAPA
jgi:O-antigen ligase